MTQLQVIARYTVSAGQEDAVAALVPELAKAARTEPGNVSFDVYRSFDDPRSLVLLERYVSREAFAEHRETEHFKRLVLEGIVPLLDERTVELYDVTG
ncbi:putative quinol monooxygenase [Amycolatopsis sp. FDAARGOS 1241]|uniref:putative quinol monooxygenase n=1 Tax=Amycolatopsis sp. FDAARGOS 1241 TaxID=2778070 RepID=UPI00195009B5|nr:putative quinol monooxygenase [Amycolatopsis sp. FDAARGOS 1241]QRP43450.1 antibiotic biosynthesis monooxygenase [Amycolatopsis sp. FDAARGOS 1241]